MTLSIEFENTTRSGEHLSELLKKDRPRIEPRVDAAQEHTKVTAKEKTATRNAALRRVKDAISIIVGAAGLQFVDDPGHLALYEAILPSKRSARPAPKA